MTKNELGQWTWTIFLGKNLLPSKYYQLLRYRGARCSLVVCWRKDVPSLLVDAKKIPFLWIGC